MFGPLYLIVAVVVAVLGTARLLQDEHLREDGAANALLGLIAGLLWPFTLVVCVIYAAAKHLNSVANEKEERH